MFVISVQYSYGWFFYGVILFVNILKATDLLTQFLALRYRTHTSSMQQYVCNWEWLCMYLSFNLQKLVIAKYGIFFLSDEFDDEGYVEDEAEYFNETSHHIRRRRVKRSPSQEYFIEIMVVADSKMADYHGSELNAYVLTLMSIVSHYVTWLFECYFSSNTKLYNV